MIPVTTTIMQGSGFFILFFIVSLFHYFIIIIIIIIFKFTFTFTIIITTTTATHG